MWNDVGWFACGLGCFFFAWQMYGYVRDRRKFKATSEKLKKIMKTARARQEAAAEISLEELDRVSAQIQKEIEDA